MYIDLTSRQLIYFFENSNGLEDIWIPHYCLHIGSALFDKLQFSKSSYTLVYKSGSARVINIAVIILILDIRSLLSERS